jgi:hypothetical protein
MKRFKKIRMTRIPNDMNTKVEDKESPQPTVLKLLST